MTDRKEKEEGLKGRAKEYIRVENFIKIKLPYAYDNFMINKEDPTAEIAGKNKTF